MLMFHAAHESLGVHLLDHEINVRGCVTHLNSLIIGSYIYTSCLLEQLLDKNQKRGCVAHSNSLIIGSYMSFLLEIAW